MKYVVVASMKHFVYILLIRARHSQWSTFVNNVQLGLNAFKTFFVSEYVNQNVSMFILVMVSRRWENRRFDCMGGWVLRCTAAILCSIYWNCNVSKVYWQWPLTMAYCRALYCKLGQFFKKLTIVLNRYNALSLNFGHLCFGQLQSRCLSMNGLHGLHQKE